MAEGKCSLIIATYNWPEALNLCLASALEQSQLPAEIIIADDGSAADTKALIDHYSGISPVPIYHVWHPDDGFRKTIILNKAVHQSTTPYIVQVDGDVILNRHFIADHIAVAEQDTFVRGTRGMLTPAKTQQLLQTKNHQLTYLSSGVTHRFNAFRMPLLSSLVIKKRRSSNSVRGSNLAFWKSDFIKINGYDNTIAGWGHEDEELAARFINLGLVKKVVKLRAIQFHLYHPGGHRNSALLQREKINTIKANGTVVCENGYQQI